MQAVSSAQPAQPAPAQGARLRLDGVAVARGGRRILEGVCFEAPAGGAVILKGPNGAGKTTLLRAIAGLAPVECGRIELAVAGAVLNSAADRRARIVHCGHADAVKAQLSVRETLAFWSRLYGASPARTEEALASFALAPIAGARAGDLSAGQRRRLALSRLILSGKSIWLLDEPTSSVDASSVGRLHELIEEHLARGGIAIIATHDKIAIAGAQSLVLETAPAT